jgi:AcrR family transcriptional regulator
MVRASSIRNDPPLRGRPKRQDSAQRQHKLLETAMALFIGNGLAVTMDTIASAANVSKRTLYASYPDKISLFLAVLEWLSSQGTKAALSLPPDMPLVPALVRYGEALFDHYSDPRTAAFLRLMQKEKERVPDLDRMMREEVVRDQVMPLVRYLERQFPDTRDDPTLFMAARMHVRNVIGEISDAYADGRTPDALASRGFLEASAEILASGLLRSN